MKSIIFVIILFSSFFSFAEKEDNINIKKEKYELVIEDGNEIIFKTGTLKPRMIFEEKIVIENITDKKLKSVIYDFKLDKKTALHSHMDFGEGVKIGYSNDNGKTFSKFPIIRNNKEIEMKEYTDIRMYIKDLPKDGNITLKVRYSYDHFAQE